MLIAGAECRRLLQLIDLVEEDFLVRGPIATAAAERTG